MKRVLDFREKKQRVSVITLRMKMRIFIFPGSKSGFDFRSHQFKFTEIPWFISFGNACIKNKYGIVADIRGLREYYSIMLTMELVNRKEFKPSVAQKDTRLNFTIP